MTETCETNNKPKIFRELIKSWYFWKPVSGILVGAILGFLYYHFVGCSSGSCAITGSPISSTIFGAALGFFVASKPCSTC